MPHIPKKRLALGLWKTRENCYSLEHYQPVFKSVFIFFIIPLIINLLRTSILNFSKFLAFSLKCFRFVFKYLHFASREYDPDHGVLYQPSECSLRDTVVCPEAFDGIYEAKERALNGLRKLYAEKTKEL